MKLMNRVVLICCLISSTGGFWAGQEQDAEGSKDHPLISRYPGSHIIGYVTKDYDEYLLATGRVADDKPTKSQNLQGKITRITYVAPSGRSTLEVFRNYQSALRQGGFQVLFSCNSDDECGAGKVNQAVVTDHAIDYWNGGFSQRHLSAKLSRPEGDVYVSLYVINNTEGGPATQLDIIEMKPMESGLVTINAATLAADINRTGHASVYGIYFDTGKADVKPESEGTLGEIAKLMQQDPKLKLYVVGHTDNQGALEMNMDLSRRRAAAVVQVLTSKHGIAMARLSPQGDGPTAPVASNDSEGGRAKNRRVELVKQ